jgi:hypothetical protein
MSIKSQAKKKVKEERKGDAWDAAIAEAKERIKRLRYSISVFKARKKAGDPWPSEPATQI